MKFNQKTKKLIFPILTFLTALTVGISVSVNLGSQIQKNNLTTKNSSKVDPVQLRIKKYMNAGEGAIASNSALDERSFKLSRSSSDDGTDLSGYAGLDISKIDLQNVFTNGGSDAKTGTVWHQQAKPNTGIIVVNTNVVANVTLSGATSATLIKANAYDYVNLKYVQYNKNTGSVIDVLAAPPPGLFASNSTAWPTWKTGGEKNTLADFFPTRTIRNIIQSTFGFTPNQSFNETEWFAKLNATAFTLDLRLLFLNSIAELFNPNLIWGFGIYDLSSAVVDTLSGAKAPTDNNEIAYNGLHKIIVNNNELSYFPNPQFKNMPALRYIEANNNKIKAIGDFATYETGDLDATKSSLDGKKESYYLYLESLWADDSKYKNDPAVMAIKKWLTITLPTKSIRGTSNKRKMAPDNQRKFQYVISSNDVYLPNKSGDFITSSNIGITDAKLPDSSGNFGALNFASVILNVSKNLYKIDFSDNEIERLPVTPVQFTYVNFSNNKLRYVPPIALEPLPWNYLATAVNKNALSNRITLEKWEKAYSNDNSLPDEQTTGAYTLALSQNVIAPSLQFNNNQILDWWPNSPKVKISENDGWYTWPNTTTSSGQGEPPVANTIASTRAQAPDPYFKKADENFLTTTGTYSAYLHRNFITKGSYGGLYNNGTSDYNSSAANLLGDWIASGYTSGKTADFYRYYFANYDNNIDLFSQQNFTTSLNFNLFSNDSTKQKSFVLPGYNTTGKRATGIANFNSGKTSTSDDNNQTTDNYYDNLVPYVLGRTLPQNWTTSNSWNGKKLKVELLNNSGTNLLSSFKNLNWKTVFDNLNNSSFSGTNQETNFIKQIIGALPNLNGTSETGISGASNVAEGISRNLFQNNQQLTLSISELTLNLNYTYNINILNNLDYSASGKHLFSEGTDKDSKKVSNIAASTFFKKSSYATQSQISQSDLFNQLNTWLDASDYVKLYLDNNPEALKIINYDMEKGEIQVQFSIQDVNGNPVNLVNLDNNILTIKGFTPLSYSFVDDSNAAIAVDDNTKLDALTNNFLPETEAEMKTWITNHFQVNWLGLDLQDGGKTAGVTASRSKGYYKLSELKNSESYITNLRWEANKGSTSFTILIPASSTNDNVALFFTKNLNSFWQFGMTIDVASYNKTEKKTVADFKANPSLLKQFVKLAPTRMLNDGSLHTETALTWNEENSSKYIPTSNKLELKINEGETSQAKGVLAFDVNLLDLKNNLISTQKGELSELYNYTSEFGLKGNSTIGTAGVRYIEDSSKENIPVKTLVTTLKSYSNNVSNFRTWIQPLIDFTKSDKTYSANVWSLSELPDANKVQLVYGFGSSLSLSAADINSNVSYNELASTITINNLAVKGGYKEGIFYPGSNASAPVTFLPNSTISFFTHTTQLFNISSFTSATPVSDSNWQSKTYQGYNAYFKNATEKWKGMLPSEWVVQLSALKNNNRTNTVNADTYKIGNYDSLYSFLNHVLNTSTSNTLFQTRVDISNVGEIKYSDFTGIIKIPANTLLIFNHYSDANKSTPDPLQNQPKKYDKEITFQLSDYKSLLPEGVQKSLPWKQQSEVNLAFQAISTDAVTNSLNELLADAQKFYNNTATSSEEQTKALTAIQVLANYFIANEYFNQVDANAFFTEKFGAAASTEKANSFTEFSSITYEDVDAVNGTMKIKVQLKNYISGFDSTTNKYNLEDKTQTFVLTNLSRLFGSPVWNNNQATAPNQTVQSETLNLSTVAPELNLSDPATNKPIFTYRTVSRPDFMNHTAESYYQDLMADSANQSGEYIKIGPDGFNFANWSVVNNYGIVQNNLPDENLKSLINKLSHAELVVKKSDIHLSKQRNQIYFLNAAIHFTGTYNNLTEKQKAMENIYDPAQNSPGHIPFGDDNNFLAQSLSNIALSGFKKVPTQISLKQNLDQIVLGNHKFAKNEILPSQIYEWIQNNYSNSADLYNLFTSFYNVTGTSDFNNPLTIVLNPVIVRILDQTNGSRDISEWVGFNDGLGKISFQNVFFITNTFENANQTTPSRTVLAVNHFMSLGSSNNFDLSELKNSSLKSVQVNQLVKNQISSNINVAVNQLKQNDYEMAYKLLFLNEIKTNLLTDETQLKVTQISSDLQSGQLLVHYTIRNNYVNGHRVDLSGIYVLNNLYNPLDVFLKQGLAPLLIVIIAIILGVAYANYRYRNHENIKKFTLKKVNGKKG